MKQRIPPFLHPGDTIGLSATARFATPEIIATAKTAIEAAGFQCYYEPSILEQFGQVAGTVEQRVASFNALVHHPEVKAIWNVRGGYGSAEIVDLVDWDALVSSPKWLVGFSDFTTFLCHGVQRGIATLHAPMPVSFQNTNAQALAATFEALKGNYKVPEVLAQSGWEGQIIAGNLSVIFSILGTPSLPNLNGCILVIEDLDEYHYHLDRMLLSMKRQGQFKELKGVVISAFSDIHDHEIPWGHDVEHTLNKHFESAGVAVIKATLIGHEAENWPVICSPLNP